MAVISLLPEDLLGTCPEAGLSDMLRISVSVPLSAVLFSYGNVQRAKCEGLKPIELVCEFVSPGHSSLFNSFCLSWEGRLVAEFYNHLTFDYIGVTRIYWSIR